MPQLRVKTNTADHHQLALWAAECAEHVLPLFDRSQPDDDRPRLAIQAGRGWITGKITMVEARAAAFAAHAAAREATDEAARAAARAAGHAAATAHVPSHARHAANYAVAAVKAAAQELEHAAALVRERDWQRSQLSEHLWSRGFAAD